MANTVKLRRSAVQSAIPTTSQLALGELALNTYDGKLYTKKDDGTESIVEIGGGSSGVSSFSAGSTGLTPSTTTTGAITLAGTLAVANGGTGVTTSTGTGSTVLSASPALTGTPTAPTAASGTNTTQLATTAFVSSSFARINTSQTFTGAQIGSISTLTDAATISMNASLANNFTVTLGGNRTFGNPSSMTAGQVGSIFINQDGTGNRTLAWAGYWKFPGGTAPTLSTSASAQDRVDYIIKSSTEIHAQFSGDFS